MADEQTHEVGSTLAPLAIKSYSDRLHNGSYSKNIQLPKSNCLYNVKQQYGACMKQEKLTWTWLDAMITCVLVQLATTYLSLCYTDINLSKILRSKITDVILNEEIFLKIYRLTDFQHTP
jgi:hypothetical protein